MIFFRPHKRGTWVWFYYRAMIRISDTYLDFHAVFFMACS